MEEKVTVKQSVLVEVLKTILGDCIIKEVLRRGEISIVDDHSGREVGVITMESFNGSRRTLKKK